MLAEEGAHTGVSRFASCAVEHEPHASRTSRCGVLELFVYDLRNLETPDRISFVRRARIDFGGRVVGLYEIPHICAKAVLGRLDHYLIDVAPSPVFASFHGLHDGMMRSVEVFGGVLVF